MNGAPRMRRWAIFAVLPLAAAAALRANDGDEAPPRGSDGGARAPTAASSENGVAASPEDRHSLHLDLDRLKALARRHVSEQPPVDPFAAPETAAADSAVAAAKSAPPPPPSPQAPALPFRFIGRQDDGGAPLFFLEQQQQTHIVRIGETVADGWRLDRADDQALVFTYVPLGQQRRLPTGSAG